MILRAEADQCSSLSSFHLGRPFRIDSEEVTVLTPYRAAIHRSEESERGNLDESQQDGNMLILREWVYLCETLVPLIRKL